MLSKKEVIMKSRILTVACSLAVIGATFALSSCQSIEPDTLTDNKTITIDFEEVSAPETDADADATRTAYHEKTIWWKLGDQVSFCQYASVGGEMTYKSTYVNVSSDKALLSVTIGNFNTPDDATDSYYCSAFPRGNFTHYRTSTGHLEARITTPATQTPTADSFDPAADLLISNYVENLTQNGEGKYSIKLAYFRQVALAKMRIINLPSASKITSVVFKAEHNRNAVVLAGAKWYDFTTLGPTSTYSSNTTLTLDYSAEDITGDMTAHFCCYPFELGENDWFEVVVNTEAGEAFTRRVTLSSLQSLTLEAGRATQFTVDMSTALQTDSRFTVNEYNSGSYVKTTYRVYFTMKKTVANDVVSGKFKAVTEDVFAGISDISAYLDENGTAMSAASITSINDSGTSYISNSGGLTGDTWCVAMAKLVFDDATEGVAITRIRTDWVTVTASTRAAGGISYYIYGKDLASTTRAFRVMATDGLPDGQTYETYYTGTLQPGLMSSSNLETVNGKNGATSTGWYVTKYYTAKSTTVDMTAGTSYTAMIKVTNLRGETKFLYASATAGGE